MFLAKYIQHKLFLKINLFITTALFHKFNILLIFEALSLGKYYSKGIQTVFLNPNIGLVIKTYSSSYQLLCNNVYTIILILKNSLKKFILNLFCLFFRKKLYTVIRSPFVFKKSKEHYVKESRSIHIEFLFILRNYFFLSFLNNLLLLINFKSNAHSKQIYLSINS